MVKELKRLIENFILTNNEDDEVDMSLVEDNSMNNRHDRCLVGKLLSGKPFNLHALSGALQRAWKVSKGFKLQEVDTNLFVYEVGSKFDKF